MAYNPKDRFFHKAKEEGFLARSAYKLQEIQKKYRLIKSGDRVLDLGCSPGSWSQVALKIIGPSGFLVGVDLKSVTLKSNQAQFLTGDFRLVEWSQFEPFNVLISDMAPNTTGIRVRDQALSEELCLGTLELAEQVLKPGGHLVMKLFEGPDAESVVAKIRSMFSDVKRFKPEAVRKGSFETYLIGIKKIPAPRAAQDGTGKPEG